MDAELLSETSVDKGERKESRLVALLDVLGARVTTIAEARKLVERIQKMVDFHDHMSELLKPEWRPSFGQDFQDPNMRMFGDSVLLWWNGNVKDQLIHQVAFELIATFIGGLVEGLPVRGVVGIGAICDEHRDIILGPGITDVAQWYDKPDMLGIFATPTLGFNIGRMVLEADTEEYKAVNDMLYYKYAVPINAKGSSVVRDLWSIAWPRFIRGISESDADAKRKLVEKLTRFTAPLGTEQKYEHTINYFQACIRDRVFDSNPMFEQEVSDS